MNTLTVKTQFTKPTVNFAPKSKNQEYIFTISNDEIVVDMSSIHNVIKEHVEIIEESRREIRKGNTTSLDDFIKLNAKKKK